MKKYVIFASAVIFAALVSTAIAAEEVKVTLNADKMKIEQAALDLSRQAGVQIICDSGVTGTVICNFQAMNLESVLDAITGVNDLKWQKFYVPAQAAQKPTVEQMKSRAEALTALAGETFIVCDPVTKKQRVFVEQDAAAPTILADKLGLTAVYLICKPKTETKAQTASSSAATASRAASNNPVASYQALQSARSKFLAQMTPDQRMAAMRQDMITMREQFGQTGGGPPGGRHGGDGGGRHHQDH